MAGCARKKYRQQRVVEQLDDVHGVQMAKEILEVEPQDHLLVEQIGEGSAPQG